MAHKSYYGDIHDRCRPTAFRRGRFSPSLSSRTEPTKMSRKYHRRRSASNSTNQHNNASRSWSHHQGSGKRSGNGTLTNGERQHPSKSDVHQKGNRPARKDDSTRSIGRKPNLVSRPHNTHNRITKTKTTTKKVVIKDPAHPPQGFVFVPKGDIFITRKCTTMAEENGVPAQIVYVTLPSTSPSPPASLLTTRSPTGPQHQCPHRPLRPTVHPRRRPRPLRLHRQHARSHARPQRRLGPAHRTHRSRPSLRRHAGQRHGRCAQARVCEG